MLKRSKKLCGAGILPASAQAGCLHHNHGFTLIELVLVMLIVAIAMGIVAPSLSGFLSGRKTVNATNQIVALARHARSRALADGRTYRLNVDTRSGEYWLELQDGGLFSEVLDEHGQRHRLPDGVTAAWKVDEYAPVFPVNTINEPQRQGGLTGGGGIGGAATGMKAGGANQQGNLGGGNARGELTESYVTFFPDGRHESLILTLTDDSGEKIDLGAYSETENWGVMKEEAR